MAITDVDNQSLKSGKLPKDPTQAKKQRGPIGYKTMTGGRAPVVNLKPQTDPHNLSNYYHKIHEELRNGLSLQEALDKHNITMDLFFEATALNKKWKTLSPASKDKVIKAYTSDEEPKQDGFKKFSQYTKDKKKISETAGAGDVGTDQLVAKYMSDTPGQPYMKNFHDAMNHYISLIMKPENRGRPWQHIAGDVKKEYPNIEPVALDQMLRRLIGASDQEIKLKRYDESEVWDKPNPVKNHKHLSPSKLAKAKARARAAGRPYPNMVDNMAVAREEFVFEKSERVNYTAREINRHLNDKGWNVERQKGDHDVWGHPRSPNKIAVPRHTGDLAPGTVRDIIRKSVVENNQQSGCPIDEDIEEIHEFIEENFIPSGNELYEDWGEPLEEATKAGHKVSLGKPFLTPGGPKKRAVYVKNERGNVIKVNFGDPNMRIKKSSPTHRKSFRARHNCANPGPRTKARYWSCRQW